jgi:uncharacterized protein YodC (DUF2158 family)
MRFRVGNLVKHKSGGPIMMIDLAPPEDIWLLDPSNHPCGCIWVEDRARKFATFGSGHLQAVYADGSPRDYDQEA